MKTLNDARYLELLAAERELKKLQNKLQKLENKRMNPKIFTFGDTVQYIGTGCHNPGQHIIQAVSMHRGYPAYSTNHGAWIPHTDFKFIKSKYK